jgi:hypothetical protein
VRTSAGLSPKDGKIKNKKNNFFCFFFCFFCRLMGAGGPVALCDITCDKRKNIKQFLFLFLFYSILFFYFVCPSGLIPRTSVGLSHGSPPTSYLLTPTSYLYYYIRLLMSLISLFFFALTFGKPLNYFTCEKEDF